MAAATVGRADLKVCIASTRQHIFDTSQTLQNFNLAASVDVLKMAFAAQHCSHRSILAGECNGKPAYQSSIGGFVLFQPTDRSSWMMGPSTRLLDCVSTGWIRSNGNGGSCPATPDGAGCAGGWQEWDGNGWQDAPALTVSG